MRIVSFTPIPEDVEEFGLVHVRFERLGALIVLAGPNGGGKSRVLQLLQHTNGAAGGDRHSARKNSVQARDDYGRVISEHEKGRRSDSADEVARWREEVRTSEQRLSRLDAIKLDQDVRSLNIVSLVPKDLALDDPLNLAPNDALSRARRANNVGVDTLARDALSYIQTAQNRQREATNPEPAGTTEERAKAVEDYRTLSQLIEDLLLTKLTRSVNGEAMLFGRTLGNSRLSDGQKVLLQLAVAVHPSHDDSALVVHMDEPENHLHPAALIFVLDRVRKALPHAQIWVATHSVPLLAHLYAQSPDSLHFVSDGSVTFAGTKPQVVLKGLLGDEEEQAKLLTFLDLPHAVAATQFAAACLQSPTVAEHRTNDAQVNQIRELILRGAKPGRIKLLDLGAGKGRLLGGLAEIEGAHEMFDYVALDTAEDDRSACERQIDLVYGNHTHRWYFDRDALFAHHGEHAFDVVVMCNVLHEIDPSRWLTVVGPDGVVVAALASHGKLLVVEDLRIPVGELPNASGFFLLNTVHLQKLFNADQAPNSQAIVSADAKNDDRLKAHVIPTGYVARADADSRKRAVQALQATAERRLIELRSTPDPSYSAGHLHSLWSQQYTNCGLFLGTIGSQGS